MDLRILYLFAVFALICVVSEGLQTHVFNQMCFSGKKNATLNIGSTSSGTSSSFILRASSDSLFKFYDYNFYCRVLISPPPSHFTVVSVKKIEIRTGCIDNLTLSDSTGYQHTYCGRYSNNTEMESRNFRGNLTVTFSTASMLASPEYPGGYEGFIITVTAYRNTPCLSKEFRCTNRRCISNDLKCDGHNHCGDRSEQLQCPVRCSIGEFKCSNGKCIPYSYVCNGIDNCGDWSDEKNCSTSASRIIGAVFGTFFLFVALIACLVYYRRKSRVFIRSVARQHAPPFSVTHQPPPSLSVTHQPPPPTFPSSSPMAVNQPYENPYPPLSRERFDDPPPYSAVTK